MRLPTFDRLYDDGLAVLDLEARYDVEDMPGLIPRWRTVIGDLARLRAGWRPDAALLSKAPTLSYWAIVETLDPGGETQFVGTVVGHPNFRNFHLVQTSIIIALDTRELKWARTIGRFYRLLEPDRGFGSGREA